LGEYRDDVAFGEIVGEAAKVDEGCIAVVDMPGRVWGTAIQSAFAILMLPLERTKGAIAVLTFRFQSPSC
jgi:hypothetical protein